MTEFATIDFPVGSPGFLDASTFLFEHVGRIKSALQVSAAEFALFVCFVAGALTRFLDLDLVVGKLRYLSRLRSDGFTGRHGSLHCVQTRLQTHCTEREDKPQIQTSSLIELLSCRGLVVSDSSRGDLGHEIALTFYRCARDPAQHGDLAGVSQGVGQGALE